jgi:hypothetical protein
MKSKYIAMGVAALASIAMAFSAQANQLIVNGDFTELSNGLGQIDNSTIATGWSSPGDNYNFVMTQADIGSSGQYGGLTLWDAANGGNNTWNGLASGAGNFVAMDGFFQTGPMSQTINGLAIGKTYDLTFSYAFGQQNGFDGATVQSLDATIGSTDWNSGDTNVDNHGFTGWRSVDVSFKADAVSETLTFLATGNKPVPPFALVSNVSLFGAAPEPSTWAMMLIGVAGLGAAARIRRRKVTVAT